MCILRRVNCNQVPGNRGQGPATGDQRLIMYYMKLHINDGVDDKSKRVLSAITNCMKQALNLWHKKTLPKHFKLGAARRYRYERRSIGTIRKKKRKQLPPLVDSGRARDRLTRMGFFQITGSKGVVTGRFIAAGSDMRYFYMKPPGHPDKPDEVKRLSLPEENRIRKEIEASVPKTVNKGRGRKRIIS